MMEHNQTTIKTREREAIIRSLNAGVTPRTGLQHIQVGRAQEVGAVVKDIDAVIDGSSTFRLVIGNYGSGKSFFLQLMKSVALEKGLVTISADLSPDRRIYSTGGQARNLYRELVKNMSTRGKSDGSALSSVVEKFISEARANAESEQRDVSEVIKSSLDNLRELVGGYDFAAVIDAYWKGYDQDNAQLKEDAIRWLRGEFATKTEARTALGVRSIVEDSSVYDYLKLISLFVKKAGYKGLLVNLDEMVNLYKLANTQSRTSNYEQLLRIVNDSLQGSAENMLFLFGGTPEFLYDPRRGLFSYEALKSRLEPNKFAERSNSVDYNSPVIMLQNLAPEELYILLSNLRRVFAGGDESKYLVPDEALQAFLDYCSKSIGDAYFKTPRNTIKEFIGLLSFMEQNPDKKWEELLGKVKIQKEEESDMPDIHDDDESPADGLKSFTI